MKQFLKKTLNRNAYLLLAAIGLFLIAFLLNKYLLLSPPLAACLAPPRNRNAIPLIDINERAAEWERGSDRSRGE